MTMTAGRAKKNGGLVDGGVIPCAFPPSAHKLKPVLPLTRAQVYKHLGIMVLSCLQVAFPFHLSGEGLMGLLQQLLPVHVHKADHVIKLTGLGSGSAVR